MYKITLRGTAHERGLQQGQAFGKLMRELCDQCPTWLGDMPHQQVAKIRDTMIHSLKDLCPEMVEELEGIAEGSGMPFDDVCTLNFVSAIGALNGCTNAIALVSSIQGKKPVLAKTSDIGSDYAYYCVQRVEPKQGYSYLAIRWVGCLWAEVASTRLGWLQDKGQRRPCPDSAAKVSPPWNTRASYLNVVALWRKPFNSVRISRWLVRG